MRKNSGGTNNSQQQQQQTPSSPPYLSTSPSSHSSSSSSLSSSFSSSPSSFPPPTTTSMMVNDSHIISSPKTPTTTSSSSSSPSSSSTGVLIGGGPTTTTTTNNTNTNLNVSNNSNNNNNSSNAPELYHHVHQSPLTPKNNNNQQQSHNHPHHHHHHQSSSSAHYHFYSSSNSNINNNDVSTTMTTTTSSPAIVVSKPNHHHHTTSSSSLSVAATGTPPPSNALTPRQLHHHQHQQQQQQQHNRSKSSNINTNNITSDNNNSSGGSGGGGSSSSGLEYINTAQYILLLFFQQFKEQANIVLDHFASDTKMTDVSQMIDSSVFGQAFNRSSSSSSSASSPSNNNNNNFSRGGSSHHNTISLFRPQSSSILSLSSYNNNNLAQQSAALSSLSSSLSPLASPSSSLSSPSSSSSSILQQPFLSSAYASSSIVSHAAIISELLLLSGDAPTLDYMNNNSNNNNSNNNNTSASSSAVVIPANGSATNSNMSTTSTTDMNNNNNSSMNNGTTDLNSMTSTTNTSSSSGNNNNNIVGVNSSTGANSTSTSVSMSGTTTGVSASMMLASAGMNVNGALISGGNNNNNNNSNNSSSSSGSSAVIGVGSTGTGGSGVGVGANMMGNSSSGGGALPSGAINNNNSNNNMGSSGYMNIANNMNNSSTLVGASIDWDNMMSPADYGSGVMSSMASSSNTNHFHHVMSMMMMGESTDSMDHQMQYMDQFYRWNSSSKDNNNGNMDVVSRRFEQLLAAFSTVSKHSLNPTIEALYDWRMHLNCKPDKRLRDKVEEQFRMATRRSTVRQEAILTQFTERKEIAADYIFCLAVLLVLGSFHQPELTLKNSEQLENMCLDRFKKAHTYLVGSNTLLESKKKTLDFLAEIIGILSIKRFAPITERFTQEIKQRVENSNLKHEAPHLVRGMKYMKIRLGRSDHVMETVNFMKKIYDSCIVKGKRTEIKIACYEAVANILSPLAAYQYKSGTEYREWFEVLKNFLAYSTNSAKKSKYALTAYPFISTLLCLSVPTVFMKHFPDHLDRLIRYVRSDKLMALDSIIHVLGYYLQLENPETEKAVLDRLQKISNNILPNRRTIPTSQNDPIYESIVDIIVMIANKTLDFAMKQMVLECLKSDFASESVYVGLKAFLAIANQSDLKKFSAMMDDDINDYPPWISKLLQRSANSNGNGGEELDSSSSATVRIHSPFSSYRTNLTFNRTTSFSLSSEPLLAQRLMSEIGVKQYEEQLSQSLSSILHNFDANFGNYLIINQTRPLHEVLSRDKYYGLRVFGTALSCIPRLLPNQISPKQLADMLCRCILHQHRELRDVSWDVMCQLMDNEPTLRAVLVHSFGEMIQKINDFHSKHLLYAITKFLALLLKWIDNLQTNQSDNIPKPTCYGKLNRPFEVTPFELGLIESLGLILLCNLDPGIRLAALQIFTHSRTITSMLMSNDGKQLDVTTVADLLDEVGYSIVKKIWKKEKYCPLTLERFIADPESKDEKSGYYYLCDFLKELAHYVSEFCLPTANISMILISKRIKKIDNNLDINYNKLPISQDTKQLICLWRNYISFCCAVTCKHMFYEKADSRTRRESREIESPESLFDSVIKHLKCNCDIQLQSAVNALGGVRPDLLELLLERLSPLETEVASAKQKKQNKRKDVLRIQLARVYARMTSIVNESKLSEKSLAIDRFVAFIDENYNYLITPACMYNIELLSLRYNFFIIIENMARKMHYVQPFFNKFDIKLRSSLMRYSLQWTGYGEANSRRESEELQSLTIATDKSRDAEEKRHINQMYKMKTANIKNRACYAVASLLLGEFFEPRLDKLTDWSRKTRLDYKAHFDRPGEDGDSDSDGKNSQKNKTTGKNSSLRSNFPELRISLWDIGRHRSETITVDPNENHESLAIMVLKWIDEVLSSPDRSYRRIGIQSIENMLLSNTGLLPLCIDQCYNCNPRAAFGYFTAIVQVFSKAELECSLAPLLVLVMHQSISDYTSARDDALKLLHIISDRFFEEDSESGNYPFLVSSDLLDHFRDTQTSLAEKLARDHSKYAQNILEEIYSRLTFLPAENQRLLLKCLQPWIPHLKLPDVSTTDTNLDVSLDNIHPATENTLNILFDLTYTYGGEFPKELEAIWTSFAKERPNVTKVVNYLVQKGTSFPITDFQKMFSISQKISVYCASTLPQYTVNCLVTWLKKMRDISPTGHHGRQISPNIEHMSGDMTQVRYRPIRPNPDTLFLVKSDVVLIMLVEIAYEHAQVFKKHLPLLLQYLFVRMDHKMNIVSNSAKLLLVHLVHSFVVRNIRHNSTDNREQEHLMSANKLIQHVLDHHNESHLWYRDKICISGNSLHSIAIAGSIAFFNHQSTSDIANNKTHNGRVSKNVEHLSLLVEFVEDVLKNEENIKERWGHEALRWATRSSSLHNVVRSYQIFRTLKPELRQKDFVGMLHDIGRYLEDSLEENVSEEDPNSNVSKETIKTAVTIEIIDTLRIIVRHMDEQRLILFPQMFWLCAALLHSDVIFVYIHTMKLLIEILDHLDFSNECVLSVLLTTKPKDSNGFYFPGLQPLVLKGLMNCYSEPFALELISKFTTLPCDLLFDPSDARLVMNMMSLLPLLCLSIGENDYKFKCIKIAENLAEACEQKKLKKIAKVLLRFSKGYYNSQDKFLLDIRKPLSEAFFPQHEEAVFYFLIELLQYGPAHYHHPVLAILHSLLLYVDVVNSTLGNRERLITTTASMLRGPLWREATRVLDVAVRSGCRGMQEQIQLIYSTIPSSISKIPDQSNFRKFSSVAGDGTRMSIAFIRQIFQQLSERSNNSATSDKDLLHSPNNRRARRQSLLIELFESSNGSGSSAEDSSAAQPGNEPWLALPGDLENLDLNTFSNADLSDDTTTESSEFTDQDMTEVTDTDLLTTTATSRYRMTMEDNEEDIFLRKFEERLTNQLKVFKPSTPYAFLQ